MSPDLLDDKYIFGKNDFGLESRTAGPADLRCLSVK